MKKLAVPFRKLRGATPLASRVLVDYSYWLKKRYTSVGVYVTNARTFLRTYRAGGTIVSQLDSYTEGKGISHRSVLKRFKEFLVDKRINFLVNDLNEKKLPLGNIYVKLFLASNADRLSGDKSSSTYATVLNQYFESIDQNVKGFNKRTAEKFINSPTLSPFSRRLYKSVLKAFCEWATGYHTANADELSSDQKKVRKGLRLISLHSLKEIAGVKVKSNKREQNTYHKDSLTKGLRDKLLRNISNSRAKAILSLMAINGLRTSEICRLQVSDVLLKEKKLKVWSKGRPRKSRDTIKLFRVPRESIKSYLHEFGARRGALFPSMTTNKVASLVNSYFVGIGNQQHFTPHSLRHTAGQLMYDAGIPLEFIQKTLRHSDMRTTLIYAQKAIDRKYFRTMRDVY